MGTEIFEENAEFLEQLPQACIKKWRSRKRIMLLWGLVLLAAVPLLGYFVLFSGSQSVDETAHKLVHGYQSHEGNFGGNLVNVVNFGGQGFVFFCFLALAGGGTLLGLVFTLYSCVSLLLGPPKAGEKPHNTVRQFYGNLLDEDHLWGNEYPVRLAAFACLSGKARQFFESFESFCRDWSHTREILKGGQTKILATIEKPNVTKINETAAHYEVRIRFNTFSMQNGERTGRSTYRCRASGQLIRIGNRWYLKEGRWSGVLDNTE